MPAERLREVGSWSGTGVDAGAIQAQLTRLWREVAERSRDEGGPAAARTNVLTLVVYADDEASEQRATQAVTSLVAHHPSRTILVRAEPGAATAGLEADVTTRCQLDRPHICHEQINLRARGAVVEQVASAVASLLLRDLPTFLWWPGDVQEQPDLLPRLVALCDHLIVDSATFGRPAAAFPALRALLRQPRGGDVTDMQWARLTGWRDVTAQFFDPPPARPWLAALRAVRVAVVAGPGAQPPASALLYCGWLASRLGWRPTGQGAQGPATIETKTADGSAAFTIEQAPSELAPAGHIAAVALTAERGGAPARFEVARQSGDQVTTRVAPEAGGAPIERTMRFPVQSDASLLSRVLGEVRRDRVYEATLDWLADLFAAVGKAT